MTAINTKQPPQPLTRPGGMDPTPCAGIEDTVTLPHQGGTPPLNRCFVAEAVEGTASDALSELKRCEVPHLQCTTLPRLVFRSVAGREGIFAEAGYALWKDERWSLVQWSNATDRDLAAMASLMVLVATGRARLNPDLYRRIDRPHGREWRIYLCVPEDVDGVSRALLESVDLTLPASTGGE